MNLTGLDYLAVGVPFVLMLLVTWFMRRYLRSVADFLAASRCAGRYLISTALAATGSSVMLMITALEVFSKTGFSLNFWNTFTATIAFLFGLMGLIIYRFRETRALTFHQFFEVRYSKGVRVFASFLNVFSGLFNFGVQPAVGGRFFVYFCGMPETLHLGTLTLPSFHLGTHDFLSHYLVPVNIPTFVPVMLILMGVSLWFTLAGGQISVMVTDCLEGVISSMFYLVVAVFILCTISAAQMHTALLSGPPGKSFIDPFDIGQQEDFNGWYIVLVTVVGLACYRGNAWNQGFAAAAKNAHESRMAMVLSNWRIYSYTAMSVLVSIAAFTLLHHPDFASQRALVEAGLKGIDNPQMQTQMRMPLALGILLAPGVRGCFLAVLLLGLLASQGVQLHSYGSTILQDVILPLRKKPFQAKEHVLALKLTAVGVAVFVCIFSILFKPVEYLVMIAQLIGAIYLGGIGSVVWGGLYWKKGTTAGAWTSLILGGSLGVACNLVQQLWKPLDPLLVRLLGPGAVADYLAAHAQRCPLNGTQMAFGIALTCFMSYIVVSLLTCRENFNMDAMLHRGKYRLQGQDLPGAALAPHRSLVARFLNINENFTFGDKVLTFLTFGWTMSWKVLALGILLWTVFVARLSVDWWFHYTMITGVWLTLAVAVVVTVWFIIGVTRDLLDLFRTLNTVQRSDADDGTVRDHHNVGEDQQLKATPSPSKVSAS